MPIIPALRKVKHSRPCKVFLKIRKTGREERRKDGGREEEGRKDGGTGRERRDRRRQVMGKGREKMS